MMHFLVYLSSATDLLDEKQLAEILETSRKNNAKDDITGILIYMDGNIIQLLEGDEKKIDDLYKKIKKDGRHHGFIKINDGQMLHRNFPDWSMGFKSVSNAELEKVFGYKNAAQFSDIKSFKNSDDHPAMLILKSFVTNNRSR